MRTPVTVACSVCNQPIVTTRDRARYDAADHALDHHRDLLLTRGRLRFTSPTTPARSA